MPKIIQGEHTPIITNTLLYIILATIIIFAVTMTSAHIYHNNLHIKNLTNLSYISNISRFKLSISAELIIYKNGELVYKHKDPVQISWFKIFLGSIFQHLPGIDFKSTIEDGSQVSFIESGYTGYGCYYTPEPYIEIGTSSQPPTHDITKLISLWQRKKVEVYNLYYNSTSKEYIIIYTATFTNPNQQSITISEVGLSIATKFGCNLKYILVTYDILDNPITLNESDEVSVTYKIIIPVSLPFTKNFYALLIGYGLGYRGLESNTLLNIHDDSGNVYDCVDLGDSHPVIAFATSSISDVYNAYHIVSPGTGVVDEARLDTTSDTVTLTIYAHQLFTGTTLVYGFGYYTSIDIACGSNTVNDNVLIMYIPFNNPVTVPANSSISGKFTLEFKLG